jgi:hypothetical protein
MRGVRNVSPRTHTPLCVLTLHTHTNTPLATHHTQAFLSFEGDIRGPLKKCLRELASLAGVSRHSCEV